MANQLENLCEERGIKVEFISNKFIDDGNELKNSKPVIKVHKIFRECPMKVASAVVEVFTEEGRTSECIDVIERYLKEKFGPVGIKIQPPKAIIRRHVYKEVSDYKEEEKYHIKDDKQRTKEENDHNNKDKYVEAEIYSIEVNSLKGKQKKLEDNEALELEEKDVLELDIVVSQPLHK